MSNILGDSHWPMAANSSVQYYLSLSVSARPSVRPSVCLSVSALCNRSCKLAAAAAADEDGRVMRSEVASLMLQAAAAAAAAQCSIDIDQSHDDSSSTGPLSARHLYTGVSYTHSSIPFSNRLTVRRAPERR